MMCLETSLHMLLVIHQEFGNYTSQLDDYRILGTPLYVRL
jgi:hypothetical protein